MIYPAFANEITNDALGSLSNKSAGEGLAFYIASLWKTAVLIGGLAFLVFLVWGAIEWITAAGDKNDIEKARHKITNALVGLVILVGSYAIVLLVENILGINLLQPQFPTNY